MPSWLDSLGLQDYVHSFLSSGYSSIDSVRNLWELELVNVSAAVWVCAARCPVGVPEARAPPDCAFLCPGPKGSPARPSKAHHRLPRRQALRGAAPEAPEVFPAESECGGAAGLLVVLATGGITGISEMGPQQRTLPVPSTCLHLRISRKCPVGRGRKRTRSSPRRPLRTVCPRPHLTQSLERRAAGGVWAAESQSRASRCPAAGPGTPLQGRADPALVQDAVSRPG